MASKATESQDRQSSKAKPAKKPKRKLTKAASAPKKVRGAIEYPTLRHCVMCGSNRVSRKRVSVALRNGDTVDGIEADVCPACGEQYFDHESMHQLDAARRKLKK